MPCTTDTTCEDAAELNKVTRMLCWLCNWIATQPREISDRCANRELWDWYAKHRVYDRERIKREALSKLTPEERKALGL